MAEAGSPNGVPGDPVPVRDHQLLACPICLEQLHEPKSLPCLHSFCRDCLSTFICKDLSGKMASATAFPCPMCRRMTQPLDPSEDKGKWAQQFPVNDLVKCEMVASSPEPKYCKPCGKKGKPGIPATIWCNICKAFFCKICKTDFHDFIHEGYDTVDVTGNSQENMRQRQDTERIRCVQHRKKMWYYCEDHQILGCSRCIIIDHRRCEEVTTTQKYFEKLTGNSQVEDLKISLQKSRDNTKLIIKEIDEKTQIIQEDLNTGLDSVTDIRKQVDELLNTMQKDITDKLVSSHKQEKENQDLQRQQCDRLMSSIQNTIERFEAAVVRNDSVNSILLYNRGKAEIESYHNMVMDLKTSHVTVRIKHVIDSSLLLDKDSPLSLGDVTVEKTPCRLPDGVCTPTDLSQCSVKEIGSFNIKCPSDSSDCCSKGVVYLPSDHIVVADYNNKNIKLFTTDGTLEDELKVLGNPYDMCRVDDYTVAVINDNIHGILCVRVASSKLTLMSEIKLSSGKTTCGVTYTGSELIVSGSGQLYRVKQTGHTERLLSSVKSCCHLAYAPNTQHLYGSQWQYNDIAVYRYSDGTRTDITKTGILQEAFGVDVDVDGNVYVCGRASNNVVQMFGDGTNARELLTSADGMEKPRAISVCRNKFVVTNESKQNRNTVRVFELY